MHTFDRRTDRQTDRNLIVRPRLHSMQRGKKTGSYSQKNIIINSKANKYQQNYLQTILP